MDFRYIEYRETILFDEYEQYIEEAKVTKEESEEKLNNVKTEFHEIETRHKKIIADGNEIKEEAAALIELLQEFGAKGVSKACLKVPKNFPSSPVVQKKQIIIPKKKDIKPNITVLKVGKMPVLKPVPRKTSPEVITLSDDDDEPPKLLPAPSSVPSRKSAPDGIMLPKLTKIERKMNLSLGNMEGSHERGRKPRKIEPDPLIPKICHTCQKEDNPKLMPFCESCSHYYHIGCLDPPLEKVPKTSKFYKWTCSDCNEKEEEATTSTNGVTNGTEESDEENQSLAQRKKQRERAMAIRVAREAEMSEIYPEKRRRCSSDNPTAKKKRISQCSTEMNTEENGYHDE